MVPHFHAHFGRDSHRGLQAGCLDIGRKTEAFKKADAAIIEINFVPGKPVTVRNRVSMTIVVSSLSTGQVIELSLIR